MVSSKKTQRIIQLELNEISPVLIKQLVSQGHLPNFSNVLKSWHESETTSEEVYENIEPWIQWVTAHTGKTFGEHGILRLGDVHELKHDQIWEKLSDRGLKCAIVGAMNATPGRQKEGVFFPDPWSKSNTTVPADLRSLWDLISSRVQAHASAQPSLSDILKAVKSAGQFNISIGLMLRIARQLVAQRLEPKVKWRLAGLFDLFLADIFCSVQKNQEYRFLTLFLNSIAHYQHHFWRNLEPAKFSAGISAPDCRPQDNPLMDGYKMMDEILGRVLRDVDLSTTLVLIVSGLSQISDTRFEGQGGMNYYRLLDHKKFGAGLGLLGSEVFPLMSRDWQVRVRPDKKEGVRHQLDTFRVGSDRLFSVSEDTDGYLFVETAVTRLVNSAELIYQGDKSLGQFGDVFTRTAVKSGHHTGMGVMWSSQNLESLGVKKTIPLTKVFDISSQVLAQ
jgi:Type I phosphodiesterase / nucleotide pyrophosphatase